MGSCLSTRLNERGPPEAGPKLWLPTSLLVWRQIEVWSNPSTRTRWSREALPRLQGDVSIVPHVGLAVPFSRANTPVGVSDHFDDPISGPQDAPGQLSSKRSGSWSLQAPPGAYAAVPAWTSGAAWFDAVMDALRTPEGEELRRRVSIAPDTLLRIAHADMLAADADTGRGVSTAHETVAEVTGVCKKTVQRARGLLEALGLAVSIVEGRYLTVAEREAALSAHGGRQIKAASVRALTMPKRWAVENVHLPRRGDLGIKTPDLEVKPTRASARESAAPLPWPARTAGRGSGSCRGRP